MFLGKSGVHVTTTSDDRPEGPAQPPNSNLSVLVNHATKPATITLQKPAMQKVVFTPVQTSAKEGEMPEFEVLVKAGEVEKWRKDKTLPLVEVLESA